MVEPYLNLNGRAKEAMEFYESVFECSDKQLMLVSDMPVNPDYPFPDEMKNNIAHGQMIVHGTMFNFSDMQPGVTDTGKISLMIRLSTPEEVTTLFNKLLDGGYSLMELSPQSYAKLFGWVKDKFGIDWQLICE